MAQHDYNIANQTGANFRADLNNALSAISSNNSGSSEPSTMYAYEWWIDTSSNVLKLRNSSNNAWITMPFSITADNTIDINAGTVNGITSFSFSSGSTVTSILDEDNLASDSATALATQQSIKAYVDSQVTAQDLDITDGSSTIAIDLDSETLSLLGGTGVTSTASGNGVTFAIGQSVSTSDNVVFNQITGALVGNASTATALATARTISGVSFDGTSNITLDTDNIGEGSSNLYYTNARVDSRFDTRLATKTTDNLTEGSSNKYFTNERVDDQVNTLLTAGANISLTYDDTAGTLTIANTNSADITSVVAGDGLTGGGTAGDVTLAVGVDDSSIEINSDALRVKASGITNTMLAGSIANAKLANSSITVNSQAISLGGSHTFDTDDIGEGSSNLYYTDARANSAIDARVTNTFINNLSGVVADTATALATGRTIGLSGDVTASGVSFDGTGNITLSTTIAANSIALGTDTVGNYVATIAGTTNEIDVSGSGSETATVTIGLPDDVTIAGNLTVNGTTTTVNSDTLSVTDPLIKLAKANSGADSLDIGFYGLYDTSGSQDLYAGLFRDANDSGKFKLFKDLQVEPTTTVNTSGTGYAVGTLVSNLEGSVTGTVSSISNHSTSDLSEGTNLYYTDARFDTRLGTKTTDNLTEGSSNLYMTTERVQDIVGGMVTGNTETGITVTYEDSDGTLDFVVGTLNQDTTGNAATATALETARAIALSGDVVGTANFDGTAGISISTTIQANSVVLGTDTVGDYVSTLTAGTGLTSTGATSGEGVAHSLSVDAAQTQITSVGALDGGSITSGFGSIDVGSSAITTTGTVTGGTLAGTLSTAAQTNITSVGTLTSFRSTGIDDNADALAITIDSSERVGIGTTSPNQKLNVSGGRSYFGANGEAFAIGLGFNGTRTAANQTYFLGATDSATPDLQISNADGGEKVRITHAGNLGIGTTSPAATLDVTSSASDAVFLRSSESTTTNVYITNTNATANNTANLYFAPANNVSGSQISSIAIEDFSSSANRTADLAFSTRKDGTMAERMRIDSSGNLGVGTSSPRSILDLDGGSETQLRLQTTNTGTTTGDGLLLSLDASANAKAYLWNYENAEMIFGTNNTERMRIDSSGNVGIGTTSPAAPLDLAGNFIFKSPANTLYGNFDATTQAYAAFRLQAAGSSYGFIGQTSALLASGGSNTALGLRSENEFVIATGGSTERMRITSAGLVGIGTSSPSVKTHIYDASTDAVLYLDSGNANGSHARFLASGSVKHFVGSGGGFSLGDADDLALRAFDNILFATGNSSTERMRIDSSGKVGIGDVSPDNKLHVNSGTSNVVAKFESTDSIAAIQFKDNNGEAEIGNVGNDIGFFPAGAEKMRLTSTGLGIGTSSPSHDLTIQKSGQDNYIRIGSNADGNDAGIYFGTNADWSIGIDNSNSNAFSIASGSTVGTNPRVTIDSSGNVGIGDTSPDRTLHVNSGNTNECALFESTDTEVTLELKDTTGTAKIKSRHDFRFEAGDSERMRIASDGKVSIGTTTTDRELKVQKSSDHSIIAAVSGTSSLAGMVMGDTDDDDRGAVLYNNNGNYMYIQTDAAERMRVDASGKVQIGTTSALASSTFSVKGAATNSQQVVSLHNPATSGTVYFMAFGTEASYAERGYITYDQSNVAFTQTSDITLKENIRDLDNGLDTICKIKPRVFDWKDGHAKDSVGFIAQEVEEVKPDWVKEKEGIKMLDTNLPNTIPYLIKAIQEQQEQIDALQSEINKLKGE